MIIADTSGLLAFFNRHEPAHEAAVEAVASTEDPLVVSPFVLAEIDYLAATRWGAQEELKILSELAGGAYLIEPLDEVAVRSCVEIIERYRDQEIGLADASLVLLAERHRTHRILTLDHRHFGVLKPLDGGLFDILPAS